VLPCEVRLFLSMDINVTINGKTESIAAGMSLQSLLKLLGIKSERVAIEYNREIIDRNQFDALHLKEGDRLEIITFVGGGNG